MSWERSFGSAVVRFHNGKVLEDDLHDPQTFCSDCDMMDVEFASQNRVQVEQNAKPQRLRIDNVMSVLNRADTVGLSGSSCIDFLRASNIRTSHTTIALKVVRKEAKVLWKAAFSFDVILACTGMTLRSSGALLSGDVLFSGDTLLSGDVGSGKLGPLSPLSYL